MPLNFSNSSERIFHENDTNAITLPSSIAVWDTPKHVDGDLFLNRYRDTTNIAQDESFHRNTKEKDATLSERKPVQKRTSSKGFVSIFLKGSSAYALRQIRNSASTHRRFIWMMVVIVGLVGCVFQVSKFIVSYDEYPVVVNIYSVRSHRQGFPAITICNINNVRKEFWNCIVNRISFDNCSSWNGKIEEIEERTTLSIVEDVSETICEAAVDPVEIETDSVVDFFRDLILSQKYESRVNYGHQAEDFIRSCRYNGYNCSFIEFTQSVSWSYGNCYTLNVTNASYFEKTGYYSIGPESGLELILNLEMEKYTQNTEEIGARIQVHDLHQPHDVVRHGINLLPGSKTSIAISRQITERLPSPFPDNCRHYDTGDSELQCLGRCEADHLYSTCSCAFSDSRHQERKICEIKKPRIYCCLEKAYSTVVCDCPTACKEVTFNFQISSTRWPTESAYDDTFYDMGKEGESFNAFEDFRKTYLKVKVYYDTMDYTTIKQSPLYHDSEILSLVGGQIGLWLGLSLLTVFEFIEKIFVLCRHKV